jgi:hypothetical protein
MIYTGLRRTEAKMRKRICDGLLTLRSGLRADLPPKKEGSLLLATWNVREFGGTKFGGRIDDAITSRNASAISTSWRSRRFEPISRR